MIQAILGFVVIAFMIWPAVQWVWGLPYGPGILLVVFFLWNAALK